MNDHYYLTPVEVQVCILYIDPFHKVRGDLDPRNAALLRNLCFQIPVSTNIKRNEPFSRQEQLNSNFEEFQDSPSYKKCTRKAARKEQMNINFKEFQDSPSYKRCTSKEATPILIPQVMLSQPRFKLLNNFLKWLSCIMPDPTIKLNFRNFVSPKYQQLLQQGISPVATANITDMIEQKELQ